MYPDKTSPVGSKYAFTREAIVGRAQSGVKSISDRREKLVFVVSHSGFLRLGVTGYWFFNGDYRIFELDNVEESNQLTKLRQLESTLSGGLGKSWKDPVVIGSDLPVPEALPEGSFSS